MNSKQQEAYDLALQDMAEGGEGSIEEIEMLLEVCDDEGELDDEEY
jgi:hypothetical protein